MDRRRWRDLQCFVGSRPWYWIMRGPGSVHSCGK